MKKSFLRQAFNRLLHYLARTLPGSMSLRPQLHRLRGVKVGKNVFIADDVYLENEYPEAVEIHDGAQISIRAIIIAHTRGAGRVVIGRNAYVGPNTVVATSGGRTITIGEGAVISAGVVVSSNVAAGIFIASPPATPIATALVPLPEARTMDEFVRGLRPLKSNSTSGAASEPSSSNAGR